MHLDIGLLWFGKISFCSMTCMACWAQLPLTGKYRLKISATRKPLAASLRTFLSECERSSDWIHLKHSRFSVGTSGGDSYPKCPASSFDFDCPCVPRVVLPIGLLEWLVDATAVIIKDCSALRSILSPKLKVRWCVWGVIIKLVQSYNLASLVHHGATIRFKDYNL